LRKSVGQIEFIAEAPVESGDARYSLADCS
jgi:hypothetical protein